MSGRGSGQAAGRGAAGRGVGRGRSTPIRPPAQPARPQQVTTSLVRNQVEEKILPVSEQFESAVEAAPIPVSLAPTPVQVQTPRPTTQPNITDRFDELAVTSKPAQTPQAAHDTVVYKDEKFPAKPKPGTLGRPISLVVNHYKIKMPAEITVYQYDIDLKRSTDLQKEIKNKEIHRTMFIELMSKLGAVYKNKIVYDSRKNLYSLKELPKTIADGKHSVFKLENREYSLRITKTNAITFDEFSDEMAIQLLNLAFTHNFSFNYANVGRCFFRDDCARAMINNKTNLEVWKGVYASVRPSEIGLTLNMDIANAVFYAAKDVLELAVDFYNARSVQGLKRSIENDRCRGEPGIGYSFLATFRGREIKMHNGFRKKIQGFGPNSHHKFPEDKGKESKISVLAYHKMKYGIDIAHPDLPCIDIGNESYVPMELCRAEAKNSKKKLSPLEASAMIRSTVTPAPQRIQDIQKWAQSSGISQDPILKAYGISVDMKMIALEGRCLPPPDIQYKSKVVGNLGTKGAWNSEAFLSTVTLKSWMIVNLSDQVYKSQALKFFERMRELAGNFGIVIHEHLSYNEPKNPAELEKVMNKHADLQLVFAIFDESSPAYNVCKTLGDIKHGVISQGVKEKNVKKMQDSTIIGLLHKINPKLGGINFYLSQANPLFVQHLQELYNGPMMCFGADVTHPAPGDPNNKESIAAVVGSLDQHCSVYAARLYAQRSPKGQAYEMIHDLDKMVKSLLQEFKDRNNGFPNKIVFFRDGVSEGQFPIVIRHEMNKIRSACQDISQGYKPAITFIVVQKRHHTRFFPTKKDDQSGKGLNVPPGTMIDTTVVTKDLFDFFGYSHFCIQGTSRSCRYFVLHDDNNFSMDQAQVLSYYLCHIYCRCPRSVSYPAPAYYSHLAAFRGREYNRGTPSVKPDANGITSYEIKIHEKIRNKMFFI